MSARTLFRGRGLEICKKRPDISILVTFFVRTAIVGGGVKNLMIPYQDHIIMYLYDLLLARVQSLVELFYNLRLRSSEVHGTPVVKI